MHAVYRTQPSIASTYIDFFSTLLTSETENLRLRRNRLRRRRYGQSSGGTQWRVLRRVWERRPVSGPPRDAEPVVPAAIVVSAFGIPTGRVGVKILEGGWSHQLWRIDTDAGSYVIKQMRRELGSWWMQDLERACEFELAVWEAGIVPMPEPMVVLESGGLLAGFLDFSDDHVYRCHRWVENRPSLGDTPSTQRSREIGAITAQLHRLGFPTDATTRDGLPWNALDAFEDTIADAWSQSKPWAGPLESLAPLVEELRSDFTALAEENVPLCFTHRDLDPKNVGVRADESLVVFDWDYAGPRLAAADLLDVAISFAGGPGAIDQECMQATVDAYRGHGLVEAFEHAAPVIVEEGFRWLMLNAWRALGHRNITAAQVEFADSLVRDLAEDWPSSASAVRVLSNALSEALP